MLLDPEADDTYDMVLDLVNHDKERLKMLVLLTHADRAGTKMDMSRTQIEQLKLFYQYTLHHKKRESVPNTIKLEFLKMVTYEHAYCMHSACHLPPQKKIAEKYGYELVDHKLELYGVKKKN